MYVRKNVEGTVRKMMQERHPDAELVGVDSHFINPFSKVTSTERRRRRRRHTEEGVKIPRSSLQLTTLTRARQTRPPRRRVGRAGEWFLPGH